MANPQAIEQAGKTVVDVGSIFGSAGTDGLILYALILGTLLMFLMGASTIFFLLRALRSQSELCGKQSERFSQATETVGEAMRELATAIASKSSADNAHQTSIIAIMARMEGVLGRLENP